MVAEAVGAGLERGERLDVGHLLRGVGAAGRERHGDLDAARTSGLLDAGAAGEHDQVGHRDALAAGRRVEVALHALQHRQHSCQPLGLVDRPAPLGLEPDAGAVRAATLVGATERRRRRPGGEHEVLHRQPGGEHSLLQRRHVGRVDELVVHRRHGVLPDQHLGRHLRPDVAGHRAHVAVRQLEPGAGEGVGELLGVAVEPLGDLAVDRVERERHVRGRHHRRVLLAGHVRIGDELLRLGVLRLPLLRAGGALGELPLEAEQVVEVTVVPRGGVVGPGTLDAAGDRVGALAGAEAAAPADAHRVHRAALGLGAHERGVAGSVRLAEGVTPGDQRHGLLVVHRHPAERLADVASRRQRVGRAVRALGVHVDEAHLHGAERIAELAVAAVARIAEPGVLSPPEHLLGLVHVLAATTEAERRQTHVLDRDVAGEHHEVGPRERAAVLLLHRPQQATGLVEVGVVGPAVERREPQLAAAGATAAVGDAVRACRVPGHADEQPAVVTPVGGPPVLRRRHHLDDVALHGVEVERRERCGVVEVGAVGSGLRGVLVEHGEIELVGPPVGVRAGPVGGRLGWGDDGVLALGHDGFLSWRRCRRVSLDDLRMPDDSP
ncbi:unannotated protein [freshwater metagenome]|uniref:Unannotated protein n=1 Tax=freshwater metagenome TaxID=449393 RepID=A0A6J6EWQ1_9ZZZZ